MGDRLRVELDDDREADLSAMAAASSAVFATRVGTVGMSYASNTCFDSYSVRIVRPVWRICSSISLMSPPV
jgi:hypothetical protein